MTNREICQLQAWWMGQISAITKRVMEEEEKRQEKVKRAAEKSMGEYRTVNDIMDAYGCGVISAKKRDRLMDLLEQTQPAPNVLYEEKMNLLQEVYQTAKEIWQKYNTADEGY